MHELLLLLQIVLLESPWFVAAPARERLLGDPMGRALATPGAAQLWASAVEAVTESQVDSVEALLAAVVSSCSNVAGAVFAAAIL